MKGSIGAEVFLFSSLGILVIAAFVGFLFQDGRSSGCLPFVTVVVIGFVVLIAVWAAAS